MASRADGRSAHGRASTTSLPRLGSVLRAALTDFYFDSMRLVAANVAWGIGAVAVVVVGLAWPVGGVLLLPLLALPASGVFRIAARIARAGPDADLREASWPLRQAAAESLIVGLGLAATTIVLATNVVTGLSRPEPLGWAFAVLAGWGLVAVWCSALVAWPLIVDPWRPASSLLDRLLMAARLLLLDPVRFGGLGMAVALIVAVSVVLTAAILTVSIAFVALVACRSVYPAADRLATVPDREPA